MGSSEPESELVVDFVDERYELNPGDELTFGRAGELTIDDSNTFMHRVVGAFIHHEGAWWIQNRASATELRVTTACGKQGLLPPGTSDPLTGASGTIRFGAGKSNYELGYELTEPFRGPAAPAESSVIGERPTEEFGVVPVNEEQRAMLMELAASWLADPSAKHHDLPANADVAHRLGWSAKKLDRKLDYLCARLSDKGVPGLRGEKGFEATDRRRQLVEHALAAGLIP